MSQIVYVYFMQINWGVIIYIVCSAGGTNLTQVRTCLKPDVISIPNDVCLGFGVRNLASDFELFVLLDVHPLPSHVVHHLY